MTKKEFKPCEMNLLKKITSTFLLFATIAGFAQINYPGKVIINEDINIASVQVIKYDVSKVDERVPLKNGKALTPLKVDEFATHVESDISPKTHGTWTNSKDGKRIWTLAIHHKEAKSIQIVCDPFMLNKGVKLFVTDPEQKHTAGAFTFRNNRSNNIFAITPISGNYLLVQLQLEKYVSDIGDFKISSLGFELAANNKLKGATDEWYGTSAYCHVDVSCMKGDNFGFYKNAVVRIITNGRRCTGSLVNNTLQDSKPYILTAGHCIKNEYEAATAVYYFNYESPYCNGPDVAFNSMSGSSLRVRLGFDSLDFCLTELHMIPPTNYAPLYAGWNYTNDPATSTFSFHHPEGDVKKITENIDRIKTGDYDLFAPETFWHVESYETGSTEQGSSGSPLFNQDNQIIGVLTTGGLSCTPKINDLYQKMYHGWNDYSANNKRLDVWLDPRNDNVGYLNHFDPLVNYRESAKVYSNLDSLGIFIEGVESNGWGYTSGHSHMRGTKFAEKFSNKGTKYIDAIRMNPLRVSSNFDSSYVNLTIWENSLSDDKILFTQKIYLFELEEDDNQLLPLRDIIKVNNDFYIGYEIFYSTGDTFAVNMMETEENTALVYSNGNWDKLSYEGQSINGALAIEAIVFDYYPDMNDLKKVDKMEPITIYPVPANDHVQVFIKDKGSSDLRLEVINSSGTVVINNSYTGIDNNILVPINQIPHGLYIVRVFYEGKNGISKFVKY